MRCFVINALSPSDCRAPVSLLDSDRVFRDLTSVFLMQLWREGRSKHPVCFLSKSSVTGYRVNWLTQLRSAKIKNQFYSCAPRSGNNIINFPQLRTHVGYLVLTKNGKDKTSTERTYIYQNRGKLMTAWTKNMSITTEIYQQDQTPSDFKQKNRRRTSGTSFFYSSNFLSSEVG